MKTHNTPAHRAPALPGLIALWPTLPEAQGFNPTPGGPEFQVHTQVVGEQYGPDVAMDSNGNVIVVWFSATYSQSTFHAV